MDIYTSHVDRVPVAAGRFYSAHAGKLETEIGNMAEEAASLTGFVLPENENLLALIAPHAGYVFSGVVAASAFMQLKNIPPRKKVFILGSSHHADFNGASVYNVGDYVTPLGKVKVDTHLANEIIGKSGYIEFVHSVHAHEHSIEVMLPFLQYFWKDQFEIVPVVLATHQKETCLNLALELREYLVPENLFVVSTDLSHYPPYNDANRADKLTVDALLTGKPEILLEQMARNSDTGIPNLATSMCGWTAVLTLMYMLENINDVVYHPVLYQNSGDALSNADRGRVVGYQSVAVSQKSISGEFQLKNSEKKELLNIARKAIKEYLEKREKTTFSGTVFSSALNESCGAFVSLYIKDELRGCIGRLQAANLPLYETVAEMAVSSAFFDGRFSPVTRDELNEMSIEVSVLTPLKKISDPGDIELGRHGIYIKKDFKSGTFLPQVAAKTNWTKEEFLGHCARDKAGIGWDGWRDAEIFTYEAIIIKE